MCSCAQVRGSVTPAPGMVQDSTWQSCGGCWLIFEVTSQETSWMVGARVSLQVAAKYKKHTGLYRCLTTLLIFNMFFNSCWNSTPTWQYQETGLVLPEAPYWAIGAFEAVGQRTKFPLQTVSLLLLPTESFSKCSPGRKKSLLQEMEPCLGDTSQQTPKSHSTSAGAGEDSDPSLPAAQPGHAKKKRCAKVTSSSGSGSWTAPNLGDHSPQLGTLPQTRAASQELLLYACKNMYSTDHTSKHVPRELHNSYMIWGFRSRDFCIFLILFSMFESNAQEHEAAM